MDTSLPGTVTGLIMTVMDIFATLFVIIYATPVFCAVVVPLAVFYVLVFVCLVVVVAHIHTCITAFLREHLASTKANGVNKSFTDILPLSSESQLHN
jgi:hypothetical protein